MERIRLDPAALRGVGTGIDAVHATLSTSQAAFSDSCGGLHSSLIEGALRDFDESWSARRTDLVDMLAAAGEALRAAVAAFEEFDTELADQAGASAATDAPASVVPPAEGEGRRQ